MTEDDIYRTSTQYRLWSFTPESLASLRTTTNATAAEQVDAAIRASDASNVEAEGSANGSEGAEAARTHKAREVDCLTVEEEQKLVEYYCVKAMELATEYCRFTTNVKATAIQYIKRFYLSNSPMSYHPKEIMPCALFLATKTENHFMKLDHFSKLLDKPSEQVIAPEFLLTQGLRFTFDVRHPQRGLEGGVGELLALAHGKTHILLPQSDPVDQVKTELVNLKPKGRGKGEPQTKTSGDVIKRIQAAHLVAKEILKTSALLTDVYFLYTPAQIWLAAFLLSDEPLASFYMHTKVPFTSPIREKLTTTVTSCSAMLGASVSMKPGKEEIAELIRIDKKLYKCRNPDKMDLVGMNKAQKRDEEAKDGGGLDEKVVKKRKLERESSMKEGEDIFGPPLAKAAKE